VTRIQIEKNILSLIKTELVAREGKSFQTNIQFGVWFYSAVIIPLFGLTGWGLNIYKNESDGRATDKKEDAAATDKKTAADAHDAALRRIRACEKMDDFIGEYDSIYYQQCMQNLRDAVGTADTEAWAKEWAIRMRNEFAEDVALNRDRKVCLELLHRLCERWKSKKDPSITDSAIVKDFGRLRISRMTEVCLPMDRAQALYKMQYDNTKDIGMHWFGQKHADKFPNWRAILNNYDAGFYTINASFLWLMEVDELRLQQHWAKWLEPESPEYSLDQGQDPSKEPPV
jgi:hypothetical protein